MKYDAGLTGFHKDIVAAIKSMIHGDSDKVAELAAEVSPVPLKDYLREHHGKTFHGGNTFDCMSSSFIVKFDRILNNNGDTKLQLSWSQVSTFIRKYPSEIFNNSDGEDSEDIIPDKNSLELLYNTFDESEIKCPFWRAGQTLRYLNFGGVDFKCDYCENSFCEFDKLTSFLAYHCHDYEECIYYRKNKDKVPDEYSEIADIPALTETAAEVAETFNYALLSVELGDYLKRKEEQLKNEYMNFTANCGRIFSEAQERLAKNGFGEDNGLFRKWIASMGFSKTTVYRMIDIYKFRLSQIGTDEGQAFFDALPKTLQADISAPSAPPKLVEQVMNGDITTHKEYIALKKQLDEASKQLELEKFHAKQQSESFDRVSEQSNVNYHKYLDEMHKNQDLEKQIRELESQPIDVAAPDDEELDRMARERAQGLLRAKDNEWQQRLDDMQYKLREAENKLLDAAFETNMPDMEQVREFYEYLHGNALSAIKSCFDFIRGDKIKGSTAAEIKARLRSLKEVIIDYLEEMK